MDIMKHRKLIADTVAYNITAFCESYCDQEEYILGLICPGKCYINCPNSTCFDTAPPGVTITTIHHKTHKLHQSLIISLSLVGLACFIYCIFMVFRHMKNKRRRPLQGAIIDHDRVRFVDEEHGPVLDHPIWYIRTIGLQRSTIDLITVVKYKKDDGLVEGTDCSVCLSEFEDDETLRLLPKCNHAFHLPCIDTWLGSHTNCPMCRAPIVSTPNGTLLPVLEPRPAVPEECVERERENGLEMKDVGSSQNGVQPIRRSVSMVSLAATRLSSEIANAQSSEINTKIVPKRLDINQDLLQKESVLMKRSASCSGKVLFPRHNRNRNSVLPP